jgi:hypothetical protein
MWLLSNYQSDKEFKMRGGFSPPFLDPSVNLFTQETTITCALAGAE